MTIVDNAFIGITDQAVVITSTDPVPSFATDNVSIEEAYIPKLIKFVGSAGGAKHDNGTADPSPAHEKALTQTKTASGLFK